MRKPPKKKREKKRATQLVTANTAAGRVALERHFRALRAVLADGRTFLVVGRGAFAVFDVAAGQSAGNGCARAEGCAFGQLIGAGLCNGLGERLGCSEGIGRGEEWDEEEECVELHVGGRESETGMLFGAVESAKG